ncbi:MAG TPA: HD domain-containing protein [Candidatus Saccharimonadales bacterium]|nr:HD domain-containing protein [Candidatus Saccharimonadales bacterium]
MRSYTDLEIEALHKKYAPTDELFELVFTHCKIIWDIAGQILEAKRLPIDKDLVRLGCLLHDIGVYTLYDEKGEKRYNFSYVTHGIRGEEILKKEGFPEEVWRIASHHTGVGLSRADIVKQGLPLPKQDFMADTLEEELVMYADKFHSKTTPPRFNTYESYKGYAAKFGDDKVVAFEHMANEFGIPDLAPLIAAYDHAAE